MRKTLALAMGLVLTASVSFAADATSSSKAASTTGSSSNGQVVLQLQGGLSIPTSSGLSNYTAAGLSLEGLVGYAFSKDFTLGLEGGLNQWVDQTSYLKALGAPSTVTGGINHIPVELVGQYNFTGGSVVPYVVLGVGLAFDSTYSSYSGPYFTSQSWTNLEVDPGIGVAFNVAQDFNLFVQGKLAMDFVSTTGTKAEAVYAPNSTTADSPILSIPVQVGGSLSL